ncbi:MAG TPA: permease-like cell division protein FtsX [Thermoleophilia bacterium]|nr:permease-like cell division protein FtsX [Thermoleophilia bacterium]
MRLGFFLGEAFGSMRRNWVMAMAAVITVLISTTILGVVLVARDNLNQGATSLKNRVLIEVFIKDDASEAQKAGLEQKIQALQSQGTVKSYKYISKDEALKRFEDRFGPRIVQNLPINPLPASYEIQVKDTDQVDAVAAKFFDNPAVDNDPGTHNGVKYAQETVRKMLGTINLIGIGMWIATGIFALAAVLLISTTVRLSIFARRREVEIMRLVGATSLKNRVLIEVFVKDDATDQQTAALQQKIQTLQDQGVLKSATFITKEEALKRFEDRFGARIVQNLPVNPLPASWEIQVKNTDQVDAVAAKFFNDPAVDNDPGTHNGVKYAQETVRKLLGTLNLIKYGMWVATGIFALAAVLLISTTVRLSIFARRREVEIMRLVGATNWFIRWPFVLEGFITGLIGAVVAAGVVWVGNWALANWLKSSDVKFIDLHVFSMVWSNPSWPVGLLPTLAVLGAVLGALGSVVALRRYLRT